MRNNTFNKNFTNVCTSNSMMFEMGKEIEVVVFCVCGWEFKKDLIKYWIYKSNFGMV